MGEYLVKEIAYIHTDFPTKFGIPRQSGIVKELKGVVCFEPGYRNWEAFRGLEGFSHIWLIWRFSGNVGEEWSPMVKPPRLGGKKRMGVFATRSPFRPNPIGLSCVRLERIEWDKNKGPLLYVAGVDLMDGTPILDVKPYLPYADSYPDALGGFASGIQESRLEVVFPEELLEMVPQRKREAILNVLAQDPRPGYHEEADRHYGVEFAGVDVRFFVRDGVLTVFEVVVL